MIWGAADIDAGLASLQAAPSDGVESGWLMGFNEPNYGQ